jgi:hypothetical protein
MVQGPKSRYICLGGWEQTMPAAQLQSLEFYCLKMVKGSKVYLTDLFLSAGVSK